jgi:hypothetical protein
MLMNGLRRILTVAAVAAALTAMAPAAFAAPVQIDFTVDYAAASATMGSPTAPFGTPPYDSTAPYPSFSGSFIFDDTGIAPSSSLRFSDYVTSLTFQTGSVAWSIADIATLPDTLIDNLIFDAAGLLDQFRFELRRPDLGSVIVASHNTMNLRTADFLVSSACNGCVAFDVSAPSTEVPEPATLSLAAGGLALLALARRLRRGGGAVN